VAGAGLAGVTVGTVVVAAWAGRGVPVAAADGGRVLPAAGVTVGAGRFAPLGVAPGLAGAGATVAAGRLRRLMTSSTEAPAGLPREPITVTFRDGW
jgi:hypothetical protein